MRTAIVIPNGVREPTQAHGSRNQPTAVIASIGMSLAVCAAREDIAFFYRALVPTAFRFL
jgi:hypothetical protein